MYCLQLRFGRRLGTVDDGTTLRSDNMVEGEMSAGDDYRDRLLQILEM